MLQQCNTLQMARKGTHDHSITHLFSRHEAAGLLRGIEGLDADDIKWLLIIDRICGKEVLADLLSDVVDLMAQLLDPQSYEQQRLRYCQAFQMARDKTLRRLSEAGKTPETATDTDIEVGQPTLKLMRLSDEAYSEHIRHTAETIYPTSTTLQQRITAQLLSIQDRVPPAVIAALRTICDFHSKPTDQLLTTMQRLATIGQRMSPGFREFIQMNPALDPTLADALYATLGTTPEIDNARVIGQKFADNWDYKNKRKQVADLITNHQPDQMTLMRIIKILFEKRYINADERNRLTTVLGQDQIDYQAISNLLRLD